MSTLTAGHTWDELVEAVLTHDLPAQHADWRPEPALTCTVCGVLVADVQAEGGELRAWLMRWRTGHRAKCEGQLYMTHPRRVLETAR